MSLYGQIWVAENLFSGMFYADTKNSCKGRIAVDYIFNAFYCMCLILHEIIQSYWSMLLYKSEWNWNSLYYISMYLTYLIFPVKLAFFWSARVVAGKNPWFGWSKKFMFKKCEYLEILFIREGPYQKKF